MIWKNYTNASFKYKDAEEIEHDGGGFWDTAGNLSWADFHGNYAEWPIYSNRWYLKLRVIL